MLRLSRHALFIFVVTTLSGACLHFLYSLFPNPITAVLSPVNESLWEHLKILFWPGLVAALALRRGEGKDMLIPRLLALLLAGTAMLGIGYFYHICLSGAALSFDICLYVLAMALAFLLPGPLTGHIPKPVGDFTFFLTLALCAALPLFTFLPPALLLFIDLSGVHTWLRLPC